ncbi:MULTISPECIES: head GIN domain-containing protein [unclassified Agromyces]|uniref:head GIN domain-containing protein n=1 Tax=unclassified Agromyces TaxID=2639701 RepID=UPI0030145226
MHPASVRRLTVAAVGTTVLATLTACSPFVTAGDTRTEDRDIDDASSVELRTGGDVDIRLGDEPALTVTGGENVLERLVTEVDDGRLVIAVRRGPLIIGERGLQIDLTVTSLESVAIDGSGDVTAEFGDAEEVTVDIGGSGEIEAGDLDARSVRASISGSGTIEVSGRTDALVVDVSGSGDVEADELEASTAQVVLSGSGNVAVNASDELDVTLSGSGDVRYSGRPEVRSSVSGSGEVAPD